MDTLKIREEETHTDMGRTCKLHREMTCTAPLGSYPLLYYVRNTMASSANTSLVDSIDFAAITAGLS